MTKKFIISLVLTGLATSSFASTNEAWDNLSKNRDATFNIYGLGAKIDKNQDSSAGAGIMFDSEALKVKAEGTSDFFKSGLVLKVNPFNPNLYFKFGLNYLNQKVWSVVNTSTKVNQYSSSFATGYMISDSFYGEVGGSYTKLNGTVFGDYEIVDEATSLGYIELAKRWDSAIGTIDTTANAGKVYHEFSDDEASYGLGVEYYPMDNTKLSYAYQYEKNNINNIYKAQYSFAFVEYSNNISNDTYKVNTGIAIAFDDMFDLSTYRAPVNIKTHLSELNRFENVVLSTNMGLQSTRGVSKTAEAIARDSVPAISTPTISMADQTVNDNGGGLATDLPAPTVSNVSAGAVYSIVSGTTGLTINSSTGVMTYDNNLNVGGTTNFTITIKVTNTDGGNSSTTFTLSVVDNL